MKKVLVAVLGLILAGNAAAEVTPFNDKNWMEIVKNNSEATYVNTNNLVTKKYHFDTVVGTWFGTLYTTPKMDKDLSPKPVKYFKAMVWEDCKNRTRSEAAEFSFFDVNGKHIDSGESIPLERLSFSSIMPDSVEGNIHDVACLIALAKEVDEAKSDAAREYIFKQYPFQTKILDENHKK